jgi:YD repeat-containing protein
MRSPKWSGRATRNCSSLTTYDSATNQMISYTTATGATTTLQYDAAGTLSSRVGPKGALHERLLTPFSSHTWYLSVPELREPVLMRVQRSLKWTARQALCRDEFRLAGLANYALYVSTIFEYVFGAILADCQQLTRE